MGEGGEEEEKSGEVADGIHGWDEEDEFGARCSLNRRERDAPATGKGSLDELGDDPVGEFGSGVLEGLFGGGVFGDVHGSGGDAVDLFGAGGGFFGEAQLAAGAAANKGAELDGALAECLAGDDDVGLGFVGVDGDADFLEGEFDLGLHGGVRDDAGEVFFGDADEDLGQGFAFDQLFEPFDAGLVGFGFRGHVVGVVGDGFIERGGKHGGGVHPVIAFHLGFCGQAAAGGGADGFGDAVGVISGLDDAAGHENLCADEVAEFGGGLGIDSTGEAHALFGENGVELGALDEHEVDGHAELGSDEFGGGGAEVFRVVGLGERQDADGEDGGFWCGLLGEERQGGEGEGGEETDGSHGEF